MANIITLPDALSEKATTIAATLGISLEEISIMALEAFCQKYERCSDADLALEQKMAIARRGISNYEQALIELGR